MLACCGSACPPRLSAAQPAAVALTGSRAASLGQIVCIGTVLGRDLSLFLQPSKMLCIQKRQGG